MNSSIAQRRDGFDQWIHQVNRICGAFSAQTLGDEFSGHIREYQSGALKLSFVDACQARLYRTPKEVAASEGGKYFAVFQLAGSACMAQGDNRVSLCAGDITLIDASQPSDFTYHENSRQLSLILPHRLIEQSLRYTPIKCGHLIGAKSPIATLSHHLILDAARQTNLSQQESEATLDAVISLLRPAISQSEGVDDVHERIFRKTLGYIDEHIRSEDLCPELLAREVGVSMRGLYRMFARKGLVVARYIKNRRLDLCAEYLRQSRTEQKLSALGYSWGFSDSSYFSTAFKSRFGISPGEYRKQYA
ncbi:MAG: transcriptional regulator FeaR [Pseudomonas helleri]|jgi:AraC family transcriptional regulator, positive regulator of tynA and feaB|uniref:Transcriptional regulator FeaR n=1 Tax=Pseudomonas helleri TaxID=1608996 RepID=A0A6A7ZB35_9PSED|nr:transcriptional regulator FeaR [Pseudomonas helleri]MQT36731.1 transcriptional regulator FeaR [Pseudomonas helleri]MQU21722.1 transcriptional regulator FeaR [Pseudomonas helleri]MQU43336.1 transcriptional regulator FeaR [Pseudomonas helleri]MQU58457.1 transcriptional regulator FeaR [Pseudomonas helleri]